MTLEMQAIAQQLNFPTSVALAPDGTLYVAESGLPFDGAPKGGRVSRVGPGGSLQPVVTGLRQPVNGVVWYQDSLIISEGGHPGRILRYGLGAGRGAGELQVLVDGLPGFGNYQTNMVALGPDGKLYFSQGAMTNSGIIGPDSNDLAWLRLIEHHPDVPGYTIEVGSQVVSIQDDQGKTVSTGGFARFGSAHPSGTRIPGRTPCNSAVLRCNPDGSELELVAWGIRNAYGLGFLSDGRLLATDQGADARGLRPVWNCPDFLYEVKQGAWYGWPDFYGGVPITDPRFRAPDGTAQPFLLRNHAELPPPRAALVEFEVNACAAKFAQVPSPHRFAGDLIVAQFGDERPMTGPPGVRVGRNLVRVQTRDWSVHPLPALPLKRPLDVVFAPDARSFYVVDFGEFEITAQKGIAARAGSGCLWKIPADAME
jgi:glucose/arabinose dehydrogenase